MTLDKNKYPILSRLEPLYQNRAEAILETLTKEERKDAVIEADKVLSEMTKEISDIFLRFSNCIQPCVDAIQTWYNALPEEVKKEITHG